MRSKRGRRGAREARGFRDTAAWDANTGSVGRVILNAHARGAKGKAGEIAVETRFAHAAAGRGIRRSSWGRDAGERAGTYSECYSRRRRVSQFGGRAGSQRYGGRGAAARQRAGEVLLLGEPMSDAAVRAAGASALHASKPAGSTRREASVGGQSGPRRASRRRDEGGRCDGGRLQNSEEALQPCGGEVLRLRPGGVGICFLWLHPKRNS